MYGVADSRELALLDNSHETDQNENSFVTPKVDLKI